MPSAASPAQSFPSNYPAPRKYALVISCVDARLLDDLVRFLDHDNLTNRYYHVALAGASLCVCGIRLPPPNPNDTPPPIRPSPAAWQKTLLENLYLGLRLTGGEITDVYIIEHRDCGAYKVYGYDLYTGAPARDDDEWGEHYRRAKKLGEAITGAFADDNIDELVTKTGLTKDDLHCPRVRAFMMDLRGDVELMFDDPPQ